MDVFSIHDWENIFKLARRKNPFTTKEMEFKDFLDLKKLVATSISNRKIDQAGDPVNWLKVKSFIYRKEDPSSIGYRYDFSGDYKRVQCIGGVLKRLYLTGGNNERNRSPSSQWSMSVKLIVAIIITPGFLVRAGTPYRSVAPTNLC
ncbi:hypothetical protein GE061_002473 [Apolygus lucorum]|uniref:Uncharacterized protein n=1 Tax=Apolygus lucorum TaxID=248454 RepID=A0A8S9X5A5_APOLU|nr:hypothetical protein GE061_002473 [Apolygus lucorum]